jgi:NADPH:quinone reductase-like Zn-dependent oxidoreductase
MYSGKRQPLRSRYSASMRSLEITRQGTPVAPNVRFEEDRPCPEPAMGELLVRTEASSLNQLDLWVGRGVPGFVTSYPARSGSDGVGIVAAVGPDVPDHWLGKRVLLNAAMAIADPVEPGVRPLPPVFEVIGEHGPGTNGEFFTAPAANMLEIGDTDPLQAAAFGLVHLTAWRMLVTRARLKPGSTVLVTGIGGGVALALLGIAKFMNCRVIVTSRSEEKLARAMELGADEGVLDTGEDFSKAIRKLTSKRGVDVCADSIGKATHLSCIKSMARGGVFVTCGCTSGPGATTDLARIFWNQLSVLGSTLGDMEEFKEVVSHLREGTLAAVVDSTFHAEDGQSAFLRLESSAQFGKIVIDWRS